jgi:hypothetical protein
LRRVAKVRVAGSNPVVRSTKSLLTLGVGGGFSRLACTACTRYREGCEQGGYPRCIFDGRIRAGGIGG